MDPWLAGTLALMALLLLLLAALSALETAVSSARRSRLPQHATSRRLRHAEALIEDAERFRTSACLAKAICEALIYGVGAVAGLDLTFRWVPAPSDGLPGALIPRAWPVLLGGALLLYLLVTVGGETLPKALASRQPERLLLRSTLLIRAFVVLFSPMLWVTRRVARFAAWGTGVDHYHATRAAHSEEEIKLLVEGSAEEGVLEVEEKELIHSIFDFTDTVARQIMVPRIDIVCVPGDTSVRETVRQIIQSGHSRLPVFEGTLDTVIGIVHVKDLLPDLSLAGYGTNGEPDRPVRDFLRPPFFIPPGKKIDELLHEFRAQKNQLAIVVDEFGGTAGLVTIEDVLEEIVGEIEDEYDVPERPSVVELPGEGTVVDARMTIGDFNSELELELSDEENDTIGGYVFSLFGRPPRPGDRVRHENLEFVADAIEGLRMQRIRVIKHPTDNVERSPETV